VGDMYNLKEEEINKRIEKVIMSEVFTAFSRNKFDEGKKILRKLHLRYFNNINDLETKRIIAYNLALAEYQVGNKEGAKKYISEIRNEVEKDANYIELEKINYCKILNIYNETHKDEMDEKDYRWTYNYIANYYKEIGAYEEYVMAISNIYILDKKFYKLLDFLTEVIKRNDEKVGYYSSELLKAIDENDSSLHSKALKIINEANIKIS
jgi:tetratricopeptide (TPR) repeat protein